MISESVRDERRDTRVRFMLGGFEQLGQGVAGAVPGDSESRAPPFITVSRGSQRTSHFRTEPVRCTTLTFRPSFVFL
jgi:hypothetical protein